MKIYMNIFPNYTVNDLLRFSFKIKVQCVKFWKNNILRRTLQLQDIRGELDKTVVRLDEMKTRVAGREDKLKVR